MSISLILCLATVLGLKKSEQGDLNVKFCCSNISIHISLLHLWFIMKTKR